jgi:LPS export ABC transporter protein LptC
MMYSPIENPIAGRIHRRSRRVLALSNLAAVFVAGTVAVFLMQAGLFRLLVPESKAPPPRIDKPEQIAAGPSSVFGRDNENQPYEFAAVSAVQDKDVTKHVHLETIRGTFRRPEDRVYEVAANGGLYDTQLKTLELRGDVRVLSRDRFEAMLEEAHVAVKEKSLTSNRPVTVTLESGGTVSANGVKITDDGNRILFLNGVKVKFKASSPKGDAQP